MTHSAGTLTMTFVDKGYSELMKKVEKLEKTVDTLQKKLKEKTELQIETQKAEARLKSMQARVEKVRSGINKMGKVYVAGVAAMAYATLRFVNEVDDMNNALTRMPGMTSNTYQTFQQLGKEVGFSMETIEKSYHRLAQAAAEAGDTRNLNEIFRDQIEKLHKIKDPAKQASEAIRRFGETGKDLLPVIKMGTKGLDEYQKKLGGAILSPHQIAQADKMRGILNGWSIAFRDIRNQFMSGFLDNVLADGSQLEQILERIRNFDWARIGRAISFAFKPMLMAIEGWTLILEKLDKIGSPIDDIKSRAESRGYEVRYIDDIDFKKFGEDFKKFGQTTTIKKGEEKEKTAFDAYIKSERGLLRKMEMFIHDESLKDDKQDDNLRKLIEVFEKSADDIVKGRAGDLLRKIYAGDEEKLKRLGLTKTEVDTGKVDIGTGKELFTKESGGATVAQPDLLLNQVIMFKNQFILFANQLLGLQQRGSVGQGQVSRMNRTGDININVAVSGAVSPQNASNIGQEIANKIVSELGKINQTQIKMISAVAQHEQTVKDLTSGDKLAKVSPAGAPVQSPVGA